MESLLLVLLIIIAIIEGIGLLFFFFQKRQKPEGLLMLQEQINHISRLLDDKLSESSKIIHAQFGQSAKIIQEVTEKLTKLDETNRQVVSFAQQLQALEDILRNPKQRGILGEYYLEELLKNVFPPSQYQLQYEFKDGQKVDAVIFLRGNKMIPIDSKFSLENYNRILKEKELERKGELEKIFRQDLKNRIDETAKYIRPQEGTLDFALMFIPAEAVYYDLLVNKIGSVKSNTRDLIDYAVREKHVLIVSPTSFYAYLQTILQGLRAMQIEKSAKEIRRRVEMLGRHLAAYQEYMQKLGNHLSQTVNTYNKAYKEFDKMDKDIVKITNRDTRIEIKQIEKPFENE